MGIFSGILSLFNSASPEARLKHGLDLAKAGKPEMAIKVYDELLESAKDDDLRARILLNRALAYHAMSDESQAEQDLKLVIAIHQASEGVRAIAREKLARFQKAMLRTSDRTNRS
jgi:tetratricopeptide (TPR) repeat protein